MGMFSYTLARNVELFQAVNMVHAFASYLI